MKQSYRLFALVSCLIFLSSCSSSNKGSTWSLNDWSRHTPKSSGSFKVGNPYKIAGKRYTPRETYDYNESGIASWYGPNFHGKLTANGEIYDQHALTAAHKTLQIPSILRVTNLENGRSVIVRVNDRGPYSKGRIIDMSSRGADLLQFKNNGTAKVRLQLLPAESRLAADAAKRGQNISGIEIALNQGKTAEEFFGISTIKEPQTSIIKVTALSSEDKSMAVSLQKQNLNTRLGVTDEGKVIKEVQTDQSKATKSPVTLKSHTITTSPLKAPEQPLIPMPKVAAETTGRTTKDVIAELIEKPAITKSNIYIQAASFSSQGKAAAHANELSKFGQAHIKEVIVNNQKFYRVRVGPMDTAAQANEVLLGMTKAGQPQGFITVGK